MIKVIKYLRAEIARVDNQIRNHGDEAGHLNHIRSTLVQTLMQVELILAQT